MTVQPQSEQVDRARAALWGFALGDAMGMPTQTLERPDIRRRYGEVTDLVAPFDGHPVSHGLTAAQVTDDTEQTVLLAQRLLRDPDRFDVDDWARDLLDWEADVKRRGLHDLLGPSSKRALAALLSGTPPEEAGAFGTTNGGAMRILPVAIASAAEGPDGLVDQVESVCRVTHNTGEAIAAAAAVATVVSSGVSGAAFGDAVPSALSAARRGRMRGRRHGNDDIAERIAGALEVAAEGDVERLLRATGNSVASHESVPAAFGIVRLAKGDPWRTAVIAANFGNDTDTIGAMATGMAAACRGYSELPALRIARLRQENDLPLDDLATGLLALRRSGKPLLSMEVAEQ